MIWALPQPSSLPRISAKMRQKRPALKVTSPGQSMRAVGSRSDPGTRMSVSAAVSSPIGTFTRKIHSQPNPSVSAPPTSGPTATAKPVVAPQMPKAVPRSCGANSCAISASEVANIMAPPSALEAAREVQHRSASRRARTEARRRRTAAAR